MTAPTTFLSETHERFLKAVVARLPVERIIELHLFPPIRQGGAESGVAVVAAVPEGETAMPPALGGQPTALGSGQSEATDAESGESSAEGDDDADAPLQEVPLEALVSDDELPAAMHDPADAAELASRSETMDQEALEEIEAEAAGATAGIEEADVERMEEAVNEIEGSLVDEAAQQMAVASLEIADLPPAEDRPRRYTIWSARYRLILKGPDRGKWEVAVTPEADAPLVTVESVVRGVQRRAGDADEVGRWTGDELRAALKL